MKKVFIGGPFRGDGSREVKIENVKIAKEYVKKFIEKEIPYYSPLLNIGSELIDLTINRSDFAIKLNQAILEDCDALAVLPGWENSSGTKGEIERAEQLGLPIFYLSDSDSIDEIIKWLNS